MRRVTMLLLMALTMAGCASAATKYRRRAATATEFDLGALLQAAAENPVNVEGRLAGLLARYTGRVKDIGLTTVRYDGGQTQVCTPIYGTVICSAHNRRWKERMAYVVLEPTDGSLGALGCQFQGKFFTDPSSLRRGDVVTLAGILAEVQRETDGTTILAAVECALPQPEIAAD